jgi:hypothetical protein
MRELYRRSAGVVWLNPLLETEGYEPTASGMRSARPYVTMFTSVNVRRDSPIYPVRSASGREWPRKQAHSGRIFCTRHCYLMKVTGAGIGPEGLPSRQ